MWGKKDTKTKTKKQQPNSEFLDIKCPYKIKYILHIYQFSVYVTWDGFETFLFQGRQKKRWAPAVALQELSVRESSLFLMGYEVLQNETNDYWINKKTNK